MKQRVKKQLSKKSFFKAVFWIAFTALVVYCSLTLFSNAADISRLNAQAAECDSEYEQQLEENDKIKAILDSDNKDEYIEQKAREKGYVKDGETVFYDISSSK
ncbi:MAG: FtsB family cell division protein [Eubacterium sp.]